MPCIGCKYFNYDEYWNDYSEDEFCISSCEKGYDYCGLVIDSCDDYEPEPPFM